MSQSSYEAIINMAIENEVEAYEFYLALSQKDLDASMKDIFTKLAAEEKNHKELLNSFLNNPNQPLQFKPSADFKVAESVSRPALSLAMKPVDAIALAMKKEEDAMQAYNAFAEGSLSAEQAKVFQELAKMEQGHKTKLEEIYTNMAFPEVW